jgi:hypothetical protein
MINTFLVSTPAPVHAHAALRPRRRSGRLFRRRRLRPEQRHLCRPLTYGGIPHLALPVRVHHAEARFDRGQLHRPARTRLESTPKQRTYAKAAPGLVRGEHEVVSRGRAVGYRSDYSLVSHIWISWLVLAAGGEQTVEVHQE